MDNKVSKYKYKTFSLNPIKESDTFNPIKHINLMKSVDKFEILNALYNDSLPSFFPRSKLTISNFFIQEYRTSQSENMLEYYEKDIEIPMLFPMRVSDYEQIRNVANEDSNMYDYPVLERAN